MENVLVKYSEQITLIGIIFGLVGIPYVFVYIIPLFDYSLIVGMGVVTVLCFVWFGIVFDYRKRCS